MAKPNIRITERADLDLDDIGDYIAERSGEARAEAVLREIDEKIRLYATIPLGGRLRNELREGMRSFPVYSYIVFYRPIEKGIRVMRILQGSRDFQTLDFDITGDERILQ